MCAGEEHNNGANLLVGGGSPDHPCPAVVCAGPAAAEPPLVTGPQILELAALERSSCCCLFTKLFHLWDQTGKTNF